MRCTASVASRSGPGRVGRTTRSRPGTGSLLGNRDFTRLVAQVSSRAAGAPRIQAQKAPGQSAQPAPPAPSANCSLGQLNTILDAGRRLSRWISAATTQLGDFILAPDAKANAKVSLALARHFNTRDILHAEFIRVRLESIQKELLSSLAYFTQSQCPSSGPIAFVTGGNLPVNYGPGFFTASSDPKDKSSPVTLEESQATILLHELTHVALGSINALGTTDIGYKWQRAYTVLPPEDAMANADSYTEFVREVIFGRTEAFKDQAKDKVAAGCPSGWRPKIDRALALAQQWVVRGGQTLADRRPDFVKIWEKDRITYLNPSKDALKPGASVAFGSDTADDLDQAQLHAMFAGMDLGKGVTIECPRERGDSCPDNPYASSQLLSERITLCPAWENRDAGDRALYLLAAELERGGYGPWLECWRLASLLRHFTELYQLGMRLALAKKVGVTLTSP
jgi:hypothetical protein